MTVFERIDAAREAMRRRVMILGTRGIPAQHGGFETFAQYLALHLVARGWQVEVACQEFGTGPIRSEDWRGVRLVKIAVPRRGPLGSVLFDLRAVLYAVRHRGLVLTLGYNTAIFGLLLRAAGVPNLINMDGLEWKRLKWPPLVRAWFWLNERLGCWLGSHLIADHPAIADHLATRISRKKITCISYCADPVTRPDPDRVAAFGLQPNRYAVVVARPEPENSILEIVTAFRRADPGIPLVLLGDYDNGAAYPAKVRAAAGPEARFLGPLYDKDTVEALRRHARFYVHGHRMGGTNPSLVEALAAGTPVLAHDNVFNRWVAGPDMRYFSDIESAASEIRRLSRDDLLAARLRQAARARHQQEFTVDRILPAYERLLASWLPGAATARVWLARVVDRLGGVLPAGPR
jgi:glycosyltransferase involved in cell wall biosynthesis